MSEPTEAQLKAAKEMGFVVCEFPPDEDECETCGEEFKQMWYTRTCWEVEEGEYHCIDCVEKMPQKILDEADSLMVWMEDEGMLKDGLPVDSEVKS